ncbi:MAG: radical SAM protein [Syntrophobacterales bacterium]|nr:radical SAM protein [Syntrophobacterales bacterium]
MKLREFLRLLAAGGPGFCQIALTNACNARCRFCRFSALPPEDRAFADPARLLPGLARLKAGGIRYLSLTGGEPLLYPALLEVLDTARRLGLRTLLVTNAALLSPHLLRSLKQAGLGRLIISLDAAEPEVHDRHRGLPGLSRHIRELVPLAAREGLKPTASVTLSRLVSDPRHLTACLSRQGFAAVTFSYPLTRLESSYLGYAPDPLVQFSPEELRSRFLALMALKSSASVPLLNTRWVLEELCRSLAGQPSRLPCLAGDRYFYLDWELTLYPCHLLGHRLGRLEDFPVAAPRRRWACPGCVSECYLDASACQYLVVSLAQAWEAFRARRLQEALGYLLQGANLRSLASLWESRHWLRQ